MFARVKQQWEAQLFLDSMPEPALGERVRQQEVAQVSGRWGRMRGSSWWWR